MTEETIIRWEVDNVSKLSNAQRMSPITFIADLPWFVSVKRATKDDVSYLARFLYCNDESDCELWRMEHESKMVLVHRKDPQKSLMGTILKPFSKNDTDWGNDKAIEFAELLDPSKGFIKDDRIIIEAHIEVKSVSGVRKSPSFDFTQPSFGWDNVALIIEGEKVHVCKRYLAMHSSHFATLFFGDFKENNKKDGIQLKDVSKEEFIELLYVIHPSFKQITVDSYMFILALADRFHVKYATGQAEVYLIKTKKLGVGSKLLLADLYKLELLKTHCMNSFKNTEDVTNLRDTPEFIQFSDAMNSSLLKKLFELTKK